MVTIEPEMELYNHFKNINPEKPVSTITIPEFGIFKIIRQVDMVPPIEEEIEVEMEGEVFEEWD